MSAKSDYFAGILAAMTLVLGLLIPVQSTAQDVAVGAAKVQVLEAVSVGSSQALAFGNIYQGVPKAISNNDGVSAGIFEISGQNQAGIDVYLQLPEYLSRVGGGDRLAVIFAVTDASVDTTGVGNPAGMTAGKGWQNVDPNDLPAAVIIGSSGTDLYLGGKVIPRPGQTPGDYSGEIVLTVTYNGL